MHDRYNDSPEETECDEPFFRVVKAIIFKCECRSLKNTRRIDEVKAMFLEIRPSLSLVSGKSHACDCIYGSTIRQRERF